MRGDSVRARARRAQRAAGLLILLSWSAWGCGPARIPPRHRVRLAGAQIPTDLVESWLHDAKTYRFDVTRAGNPTWSQGGFEALAAGRCDLACVDRPLEKREREAFGTRSVRGYRVGFYGYALYVHPDNPLDSIYAKHLSLVMQQRVTDWKELLGQGTTFEGPIHVYGPRKATRGGDILMRQARIWFGEPTWTVLDSDLEIVRAVAEDPLGLGFAGIGYDDEARYLGLRMRRNGPPAFPSLEEIESEAYGLAKVIYVYTLEPAGEAVQAVLEYLYSPEGQAAIEATHVWPLPRDRADVPLP